MSLPALITTLHDPQGKTLPFLERDAVVSALTSYAMVVVAATLATDARVTTRLEQLGARVVPGGLTGVGRHAALAAFSEAAAYFNCDLDRWLHWVICWPEELAALPERVRRLGPGERARPWCV